MIRRLTAREQRIFFVSVAAVVFSLFYNALINPLYEKKEFLDQEINTAQEQLTRDLKAVKEARALDARYDAYMKQFRQSGTEDETASSILLEIEKVAGQFSLHVMDLKPRKVEHGMLDNQFSVSLTINSELADVIRFLYLLQRPPYLFDVEAAEFEKLERRDEAMMTTRLVLGKAFISLNSHKEETGKKPMPLFYERD